MTYRRIKTTCVCLQQKLSYQYQYQADPISLAPLLSVGERGAESVTLEMR